MLLIAEIQKVSPIKTKDGTPLFQLALTDKSKPAAFRTPTTFVMFVGQDALAKLGKADLTDFPVTVVINDLGSSNGLPKIRGQLYPGAHAAEMLEKKIAELEKATIKSVQ